MGSRISPRHLHKRRPPHPPDTVDETFDLAPVGFIATDRNEIVVRANRALLMLTGFAATDLIGQRWSDVVLTLAGRLLAETHVRPLLQLKHEARGIAIDLQCADGQRLPVLMTIVERLDNHGEPRGFLLTFIEAIDREQYQRELLEAKHRAEIAAEQLSDLAAQLDQRVAVRTLELQRANDELDNFAHVVSHDLRAPLRTMSGFSRILNEEYRATLGANGTRLVDAIDKAASTLAALIDGLLRLSLTSRGAMHLTHCDLAAIAERIVKELQLEAPDRTVRWTIDSQMLVWADPAMMEAVLRNLLSNAWKYTSKIPDARISFTCENENGQRIYRVRDNGAGFDMAYAKNLFQPFQRMHSKTDFPGLGIGLATVRRIIERHGGTLKADATPNGGATFSFTLPNTGDSALN